MRFCEDSRTVEKGDAAPITTAAPAEFEEEVSKGAAGADGSSNGEKGEEVADADDDCAPG